MTFDELVRDVASRLNLTSPEAFQRIGQRINERYRKVSSSIGMLTSRRQVRDFTVDPTAPNILPDYVIDGFEKIHRIVRLDPASGSITVMKILSYDDVANITQFTDRIPHAFAIKRMGAHEVTITFDSFTTTSPFTIKVEGYELADVLADDAEPFMPESFHDILIEGAMADELSKMEKPELAQMREAKYESRLSDLRYFIAKNSYQDVTQGLSKPAVLWYRTWWSRISLYG